MTRGPSASGNAAATLVVLALSLASLGLGCKKEIDPSAFDAGVASTASTVSAPDAGAAPTTAEPASTEVAPLAPLSSATPPATPKPAAAKPSGAAVKPAAPIAECAKAKQFCEHPAIKTDTSIQGLCAKYKDECTKKGGHP